MALITPDKLKEISTLAESVPEPFRLKCFELLLAHYLSREEPPKDKKDHPVEGKAKESLKKTEFILPIDVKAFLNQYSIDESALKKLFLIEGSEIRAIYKLDIHKKAKAQMAHALLMALESALSTGEFKFTADALRQRCVDHKCLDVPNFMAVLERNKGLFKSYDPKKELFLSADGKAELAELLEQFN